MPTSWEDGGDRVMTTIISLTKTPPLRVMTWLSWAMASNGNDILVRSLVVKTHLEVLGSQVSVE